MEWGSPTFVLALMGMSTIAWVLTTAIRARHGYPIESEGGKIMTRTDDELKRQNELLERENELLRGKIARIEERTAVLERIATDAPARLTAEIDKLRD